MDDPADITAWQRINDRTTTSGKLLEADIARLADLGVRHVINLAPDSSDGALAGEAALLDAHGMHYSYIPVPFSAPEEAHFQSFIAAYETGDHPVHVHCMANMRVSAFLYRYHRDIAGMAEAQARALMEQQWAPDPGSDHPLMQTWGRFIAPHAPHAP